MASCSTVYQVPGQKGSQGAPGTNGTNGENAYTLLAASFTVPSGEDLTPTVSHESDGVDATVIMSSPHNLSTGMIVDLSDFTDSDFDATDVEVTVIDATTFTYPTTAPIGGVVADVTGVVSNIRVPVTVVNGDWVVIGQFVEVGGVDSSLGGTSVGTFEVMDVVGDVVTLRNPYDGTPGSYPNNVAPGQIAASGLRVSPTGMQGSGGTGPQGVPGAQGNQGYQGVQGAGGQGPQGNQGNQGSQGAGGSGITAGGYSFNAKVNVSWSIAGPSVVVFETQQFDPDACYDAATGVYTAPVDGYYLFSTIITSTAANNYYFRVNTSSVATIAIVADTSNVRNATTMLQLTAGDDVDVYCSGTNAGTTIPTTEFSGFLVHET